MASSTTCALRRTSPLSLLSSSVINSNVDDFVVSPSDSTTSVSPSSSSSSADKLDRIRTASPTTSTSGGENSRFSHTSGRRRRSRATMTSSSSTLSSSSSTSSSSYTSFSTFLLQRMSHPLAVLILFVSTVFRVADACSARSTPKPRPPSQSTRPNITFPTFECPNEYRSFYCLNGARCFTVKIESNILYNCECAEGFTGPRCEFKDLDGSYLPSRERVMIETASIAGGLSVAVLLSVIIFLAIYAYVKRREKMAKMMMSTSSVDAGVWKPFERRLHSKSTTNTNTSSNSNKVVADRETGTSLLGQLAPQCRTGVTVDPEAGDSRLLASHPHLFHHHLSSQQQHRSQQTTCL